MTLPDNIKEILYSKVNKTDYCWVYAQGTNADGYGRIYVSPDSKPKTWQAHRLSYTLEYGDIPIGMEVCHHCDNPPCIRPDHLFLGTHLQNLNDKHSKNRQSQHDTHHKAKLTTAIVLQARVLYKLGDTVKILAETYGVEHSVMYKAVTERTWRGI